jgi:hypothetical protein
MLWQRENQSSRGAREETATETAMSEARMVDLGKAIETQSGGGFSRLILFLCCAAMVIEGYPCTSLWSVPTVTVPPLIVSRTQEFK